MFAWRVDMHFFHFNSICNNLVIRRLKLACCNAYIQFKYWLYFSIALMGVSEETGDSTLLGAVILVNNDL